MNRLSISYWWHRLFGLRRVDVLKRALREYKKDVKEGYYFGLCGRMLDALRFYGIELTFQSNIPNYIPEFKSPTGRSYGDWWWPRVDSASRIAFMEHLIELYKDDKTNLYKI